MKIFATAMLLFIMCGAVAGSNVSPESKPGPSSNDFSSYGTPLDDVNKQQAIGNAKQQAAKHRLTLNELEDSLYLEHLLIQAQFKTHMNLILLDHERIDQIEKLQRDEEEKRSLPETPRWVAGKGFESREQRIEELEQRNQQLEQRIEVAEHEIQYLKVHAKMY